LQSAETSSPALRSAGTAIIVATTDEIRRTDLLIGRSTSVKSTRAASD